MTRNAKMEKKAVSRSTGTAHARWLGSMAAAALAFAGTSIALAASGTDPKADQGKEVRIIKIVKMGDGAEAGSHEHQAILAGEKCEGAKPQVDTSEEVKGKDGKVRRSHIIICAHGAGHDASTLAALEKARARLAEVSELSDAAKAKALASLDEEIARLKTAPDYSKQ